ncbi:zinc-dependent peptidase [Cesiribacter andamanensis]|uniref:Mlc titration factor A n=1 Tax=Cesiribacter andamanensis AMV16 TaxID=1279009 RepID=M7NNY1_9BACT|nr:zinc-dependent peptidase [Cesiribacter andamanensis]EMR03430.1 Mlc titration factor A [Cesiribacter andamanensis AMV16]
MGLILFIYIRWATRKKRLAKKALREEFSREWRHQLASKVAFYKGLGRRGKRRFEQRVLVFLAQTSIVGIKTEVDDLSRLLIAAAAVIPTWGYREWEYPNLGEVYLTDGAVSVHSPEPGRQNIVAGQIKPQGNQHMVVFSKQALVQGFANPKDSRNVGLHEFAHLLDEQDGSTDGLPEHFLSPEMTEAWEELIREKTRLIKKGKSEINPYGATNRAEFFAVMTEYFFERPRKLLENHPRVYKLLSRVFNQNPAQLEARLEAQLGPEVLDTSKEPGRNDPCPCGSGEKYKKCCLAEAS